MIVWHVTKTWEGFQGIVSGGKILANGRNVAASSRFAHISIAPFPRDEFVFDWLSAYEAWEFEVEIFGNACLESDPSDEYPGWLVSRDDLVISRIKRVLYIEDTFEWCARRSDGVPMPVKRFGESVGKVLCA